MALETPEVFSKRIFGRIHRVTVWRAVIDATIEPPHSFRQNELVIDLGQATELPASVAHAELKSMHELGMIEPTSEYKGAPCRRTVSPIWDLAETAIKVCEELFASQQQE